MIGEDQVAGVLAAKIITWPGSRWRRPVRAGSGIPDRATGRGWSHPDGRA